MHFRTAFMRASLEDLEMCGHLARMCGQICLNRGHFSCNRGHSPDFIYYSLLIQTSEVFGRDENDFISKLDDFNLISSLLKWNLLHLSLPMHFRTAFMRVRLEDSRICGHFRGCCGQIRLNCGHLARMCGQIFLNCGHLADCKRKSNDKPCHHCFFVCLLLCPPHTSRLFFN